MPISVEITTSIPQARAKGVVLIGRPSVVLYAHKTLGNSSTHFPLAHSSLFFSVVSGVLFVASACPLLRGQRGVEYRFLIFSSKQKVLKAMLSNCGPLSTIIACRILNRKTMFFQNNVETSLSLMLAQASASTHLLKQLVATSINFFYAATTGKGPMISIPHSANDQGLVTRLRTSNGI